MRLTRRVGLTVALTLLVCAPSLFARQAGTRMPPGTSARFGVTVQDPPKADTPYDQLFKTPGLEASGAGQGGLAARLELGKPRVVCGMTLLPVDPNVDPKIRVTLPDNGTRFTIRSIRPPVCK